MDDEKTTSGGVQFENFALDVTEEETEKTKSDGAPKAKQRPSIVDEPSDAFRERTVLLSPDERPASTADGRTELAQPQLSRPAVERQDSRARTGLIQVDVVDANTSEEAQMRALLGGAIRAGHSLPARAKSRKKSGAFLRWFKRGLVLSVLATFAVAMYGLAATGVSARAKEASIRLARDVRELVRLGSYEQLARELPLLEAQAETAGELRRYAALVARAEATLFRFHDAHPARKKRVRRLLAAVDKDGLDRRIALALMMPRSLRANFLANLIEADSKDPCPAALVARELSAAGKVEGARTLFDQSEDAEPSHLAHLYAQFAHELSHRGKPASLDVLDRMRDVRPASPWTRLAEAEVEEGKDTLEDLIADAQVPPVLRSMAAKRLGDRVRGKAGLEEARRWYVRALNEVWGDLSFAADLFEADLGTGIRVVPIVVDVEPPETEYVEDEVEPELVKPRRAKKKRGRKRRRSKRRR